MEGASLQSLGLGDDVKLKELPRWKAKATELQANAVVTSTLCHLMKHQWSSLDQLIDYSLFAWGKGHAPGLMESGFCEARGPILRIFPRDLKKQLIISPFMISLPVHPPMDNGLLMIARLFFCHVCFWDFV